MLSPSILISTPDSIHRWFDASLSQAQFIQHLDLFLSPSDSNWFFISQYSDFPGLSFLPSSSWFSYGKFKSFYDFSAFSEVALFLKEYPSFGAPLLLQLGFNSSKLPPFAIIQQAKLFLSYSYIGEFESPEHFAQVCLEESIKENVSSHFKSYIDFKSISSTILSRCFFNISTHFFYNFWELEHSALYFKNPFKSNTFPNALKELKEALCLMDAIIPMDHPGRIKLQALKSINLS